MYTQLILSNFGPFGDLRWDDHRQVNVIVGENDTGKSYLLKLLYAVARSIQEHGTGPHQGRWAEVLARKMHGVFLPPRGQLGQLVRKGQPALKVDARLGGENYSFSFGPDTRSSIMHCSGIVTPPGDLRAVYVPPKEVLTILGSVRQTRSEGVLEFDDTYLDLATDLARPVTRGRLAGPLVAALDGIEELLNGVVEEYKGEFVMRRGRARFAMSQTAEGCKKVGTLARLIRNRALRRGTILFIDEPEVNLHPGAMVQFMRIVTEAAKAGVQVYLATHSYFALKEIEIAARQGGQKVSVISLDRQADTIAASISDLLDGMPDNGLVREGAAQYRRDMRLSVAGEEDEWA